MADAYEPYHVPQQSRRDKLRIISHTHAHQNPSLDSHFQFHPSSSCPGLFPLVDADLLTCAAGGGGFPSNTHLLPNPDSDPDPDPNPNPCYAVKPGEPGHFLGTFMGFLGGVSVHGSSSSSVVNGGDRAYDQSFNGGEVLVFKPEPLSLSLASNHVAHQNNSLQRYGYELLIPGVVDDSRCGGGSAVSRSSVPLGPFTGYASILKGSRFLKPAQQLLEEFCNVGRGIYAERIIDDDDDSSLLFDSSSVDSLSASRGVHDDGGGGCVESRKKKSKLISMLDEVYKRYKQYYQQLETVVTSFESVAGLGNAAPYASLALKALSKHFKCLKNAISDQVQFTNKTQQQPHRHVVTSEKVESLRFVNTERRGFYGGQRLGFSDHHPPVWRPQRGLPERAVAVLRAWLFDHFLHPYPTDTDKLILAKQTGLSRNQVSNWFINARVRVWKPMVEEIHMLETREAQKTSSRRDGHRSTVINRANVNFPEKPSSSASRRTQNNGVQENLAAAGSNETLNFSYGGVGVSGVPGLCTSGVSLTLGLHQNNGMGLPEQLPINAVQRFGFGGGGGDGYVGIGGGGGGGSFEGQNREFGRDVMGNSNQLLHDFVG